VPVVVTGASGAVGRRLVPLLVQGGSEVRAVIRSGAAADELRADGAKVAIGRLGDADTVEAVVDGAHTVVHLAGGLDPSSRVADGSDTTAERLYDEANLLPTRWVLEAAVEAGVARFLFLSYPGASPDASNPYLRAKGLAEDEIRASGLQHAIVRTTHIYGPRCRWLEEMAGSARRPVAVVVGSGRQRLAPVFVGDVARVLAGADDRAVEVRETFGLQGPDEVSADEMIDLLAGRPKRKLHLSPGAARRAARLLGRRVPPAALEILAGDSLADAPAAAAEFGVHLTNLRQGLAES
jgi:NADH dehydrogenase